MSDQPAPNPPTPDPQRLYAALNRITEQSQRIMQAFVERQATSPREFNPLEPAVVSKAYQALWQQMLTDPGRLVEAQVSLWQDYAKLWENTARRMAGEDVEPALTPEPGDRRFKRRRLVGEPALRPHQAELPARVEVHALHGTRDGRTRCAHRAQGGFLYPPVHRRPLPDEFRDDEPRGGQAHRRDGGREPRARALQHARGIWSGDRGSFGSE